MAFDCHTHVGAPEHISEELREQANSSWKGLELSVSLEEHWEAVHHAERAIVLGFRAAASGWLVPNEYVADYVGLHPGQLVGFAGIDLRSPDAVKDVHHALELGLRGIKIAPTYQAADPLGATAAGVFDIADMNGLPVMWHQGATFVREAPLIYANPIAVDEVALRHPTLKIVIAHMGHPWCETAIVVARKHRNVYLDVSALHPRKWQCYNALRLAYEYGIWSKLLLGSDYPFFTLEETIAGLQETCIEAERASLPAVPRELLAELFARDSLAVLGV